MPDIIQNARQQNANKKEKAARKRKLGMVQVLFTNLTADPQTTDRDLPPGWRFAVSRVRSGNCQAPFPGSVNHAENCYNSRK